MNISPTDTRNRSLANLDIFQSNASNTNIMFPQKSPEQRAVENVYSPLPVPSAQTAFVFP